MSKCSLASYYEIFLKTELNRVSDAPSAATLENCQWVCPKLVSKGDLELHGHVSSHVGHDGC